MTDTAPAAKMAAVHPLDHRLWIFDLDGTLTRSAHDFDAIRAALGLRPVEPILEQLAELPTERAEALRAQLYDIELEIADRAEPQPGAEALLTALSERHTWTGIVTRNRRDLAVRTLKAAGLWSFFARGTIHGRDTAEPKPNPDALYQLMHRYESAGADTVMVGDYLFDLQAGRAVGATTVHLDVTGAFPWPELADHRITGLDQLLG